MRIANSQWLRAVFLKFSSCPPLIEPSLLLWKKWLNKKDGFSWGGGGNIVVCLYLSASEIWSCKRDGLSWGGWDNIVVYLYLSASQIGPDQKDDLWWEWPDKMGWPLVGVAWQAMAFDRSDLIRGVVFGGSGLTRGMSFDGSGQIRGWSLVGMTLQEG